MIEEYPKHSTLSSSVSVRKSFLEFGCHFNHLKGISGPGAPHTYAFDRFEDLGISMQEACRNA